MSASSNNQHDVMSASSNNQHDVVSASSSPIHVGHSHCNQNETASPASWGRHRGSKKPSSRSHLDLHLRDIDIFKSDLRALRSSMEDTQYYPSSPRATLHGYGSGGRGRSSLDTRSSLTGHRSRRTLPGSVGRTMRRSLRGAEDADGDTAMESQRQLTPHRPMTPSRPLTPLPQELLYELHDLNHENEDLSAEVVHSLNLRNYDIKQVLGKGISSTVRRVVEKTTGQEFAVKIIDISGEKGEVAQVEQTKKDTYREIRILRMCGGHPNISEFHCFIDDLLVFALHRCKKGELFDYLTSVVSLSEKRTRIFMRQLLEAVEFFHRKNIVHRDLKPENILLDDNLNIKVSDFGFATVVEPGEELVELCGTPGYLAPEVLAHSMYENVSGYGKEVDMWACGVIMYTLLCGAPPFWNRRQMMMLRAIMNADYTFNSPEWDDISDPPKNLIQKLLLVNPQQRLTAKEALAHPFFHSMDMKNVSEISDLVKLAFSATEKFKKLARFAEEKRFDARRKFRAGVFCVVFYLRLNFSYKHPPPISMDTVRNNPYGIKVLRKVIDSCAFGMYRHWVKRVDNQNRAALFEHTLRDDWKHSLMTEHGIMA
ncbi:unnamed protein product [Lymnaea stagnalis]|uniref:phosphorylase kinase n=1 Tax=Lymnaea stagnalis TaxID=6523 RepID=A0AAV2HYH6_LYMST